RLYGNPDTVARQVPALRLLTRSETAIQVTARAITEPLKAWAGDHWDVSVVPVKSQIGSGSLPLDLLPSAAVRLAPVAGNRRERNRELKALSARLRQLPMPVVGRISEDALLMDCRCLEDATPFLAQLQPETGA
ncbi:MAG: L-seryl-tRNA(Sec) selenium transferase, partial [Marinobacter sp.]